MKILALDTTGLAASAAVVDEQKTIAEFTINYKKTHSRTIMPMLEQIKAITELDLAEIDYIACACGPGSFTGLRIGAAAAKGLAHGLDKKIIPVPTLDALAYNMAGTDRLIVPIMDARRSQVYTAFYKSNSCTGIDRLTDFMAEDIDTVLAKAAKIDKKAVFLGDGVPVFEDKIRQFDAFFAFAPICANMQRAAAVGALALQMTEKAVNCGDFEIIYLRKSQAEREREEQQKGSANADC